MFERRLFREEHEMFRSTVRKFIEKEIAPFHKQWEEDGIVLVNGDTCIGCKLCSWACPYGAREYDEDAGVMKKCTLCVDRIYNETLPEDMRVPACVSTCPAGARHFGDLGESLTVAAAAAQAARKIRNSTTFIRPPLQMAKRTLRLPVPSSIVTLSYSIRVIGCVVVLQDELTQPVTYPETRSRHPLRSA